MIIIKEKFLNLYEKYFYIIILFLFIMITRLGIMPLREVGEVSLVLKNIIDFIFKIFRTVYDYRFIFQLVVLVISCLYIYLKGNKRNKVIVSLLLFFSILTFFNSLSYKSLYFISLEIRYASAFPLFFVFLNVFDIFLREKGRYFFENLVFKTVKLMTLYIAAIFILGKLTNLYCITYAYEPYGYSGRFLERNSISHILVMILPILLYFFYKRNNKTLLLYIIAAITCALLIGTKSTYFGVYTSLALFVSISIIAYISTKKIDIKKTISIVIILISVLSINENLYASQFIKKGMERTKTVVETKTNELEVEYQTDVTEFVFKGRKQALKEISWVYNHQDNYTKLIGLGFYYPKYYYAMVEMDFFDILFKQGIIGMAFYLVAAAYSIYLIAKNLIKSIKRPKIEILLFIFGAVGMGTLASVLAGHVIYNCVALTLYAMLIIFLISETDFE